eukprot:GHVS01080045.1.p2 GENE.GHVS01080045.1~~GHVS01080045.1.p2  ORF type:complete len:108 (+),score=24.41 GHVS01080045.1:177-500(+)
MYSIKISCTCRYHREKNISKYHVHDIKISKYHREKKKGIFFEKNGCQHSTTTSTTTTSTTTTSTTTTSTTTTSTTTTTRASFGLNPCLFWSCSVAITLCADNPHARL